mmetsp:Transcript_6265/g.16009  ORF Transcript_6265/g.16009 Transcript_6265/m.16009 type:complete len:715 (-) Transcript_6265:352-2496(-)
MAAYEVYLKILKNFLINFNISEKLEIKNQSIQKNIKKFKYLEKIQSLVNQNNNLFEFDLEDLSDKAFPKEINWLFLSNTTRFFKILEKAINELINEISPTVSFLSEYNFFNKKSKIFSKTNNYLPQFQIIIKPVPDYPLTPFKSLGADLVGKFIFLKGIVVDVSKIKIIIQKAAYLCSLCKFEFIQEIKEENFKPFFRCPSKKCFKERSGNNLFLNTNSTVFQKFQEITVRENFINDNFFLTDRLLKIKLFGELTGNFEIGESVAVTGTLLPGHLKGTKFKNFIDSLSMEACYVKKNSCFSSYPIKNLKTEKKILELFRGKNIYSVISESFAPFVFGNLDIKKVLILSILNHSLKDTKACLRNHEGINTLILGEVGTTKTKLLKFVSYVTPIANYKNGINISQKNIFSPTFSNENSEKILDKEYWGSIYNSKITCLDDLHKIKEKDIFFLRKILKKKKLTYLENQPKTGKIFSNSIIAAATIEENFFQETLNQKQTNPFFGLVFDFNLIFLLSSLKEKNQENNLAKHVIFSFRKNQKNSPKYKKIQIPIFRSFFIEAQKISPMLPPTVFDFLIYNYIMWRSQDKENNRNQIEIKTFAIVIRLSISLARLKFQNLVSKNDINEAIRLIEISKKSRNKVPNFLSKIQKEKLENKIYSIIRDLSIKSKKRELELAWLEKLILKKGFTREEFVNCLGFYEELNIWKLSVFYGKLIFIR